jgi:hypothetical protein
VTGASYHYGERMSLEEALSGNDDGEVCVADVTATDGWLYLMYNYYLGDTQVGFFFADGEAMLAYVGDGDIYDCKVQGAGRACLFGEALWEMEENPDIVETASNEVTVAGLSAISEIRKEQIRLGMQHHHGEPISLEEAIEQTDERAVFMRDYRTPDARTFVVYDFGAGDNTFGFIYAVADQMQAEIGDGDIYDCIPKTAP